MHSGMGDYYTRAFRGRAMLLRLLPCSIPPPISRAADRKAQMPAGGILCRTAAGGVRIVRNATEGGMAHAHRRASHQVVYFANLTFPIHTKGLR